MNKLERGSRSLAASREIFVQAFREVMRRKIERARKGY